jgi:DNA-binding CsgD family transcriptional regulator
MSKNPDIYKSFVGALLYLRRENSDNTNDSDKNVTYGEVINWSKLFDRSFSVGEHILPCIFIFDYMRAEMIYFSPSVRELLGVEHIALSGSNGIIKFMDLVNPNDFKVYNEQIFPKDIAYLNSLAHEEAKDVVFSNNFRMKHINGLYKNVLMKKVFITDAETRMPIFEVGSLLDISSFKKELSITHTIERLHMVDDLSSYIKVTTEDYFPEMHAGILSAREKEILTHLSMGTKRKEVGVKLFISDNTVANHIKTILRKTHSQNIREAIAICKMNGII